MKLRAKISRIASVGLPLAVGFAAVAAASAFDVLAVRIAMQCVAIASVTLMAWRAGVVNTSSDVTAREQPAPVTSAEVETILTDRRRPTFDRETGLCVNWYFRLRVEEEIARATRYGQRFTMLSLSTKEGGELQAPRLAIKHSLRAVDLAGEIDDRIAVMLPNTERKGAEKVIARITKFANNVEIRAAEYPSDGTTMAQLLGDEEWQASDADRVAA